MHMKPNLELALCSARETKELMVGSNILKDTPELFRKAFPGKNAIIIADAITWKIAGKEVFGYLSNSGIIVEPSFIFDENKPYAKFENVLRVEEAINAKDAIPIAIGSGTLNDLTKLAAARKNRPYMCVATAASMDGYSAFGASITFEGSKQTFDCPAPTAILADIEIIRNAPSNMTASGYADLYAKITAGADWILADALGVESIDSTAWSIVQDGLKDALADPSGAKAGKKQAIAPLVEGLLLGGFAMQWAKSSRPASGAEHQFSHLWNMEHHLHNGETPSHGFQVGIATLAITHLYESMLKTSFEDLNIESCCEKWPEWNELESSANDLFRETDFLDTAINQSKLKYITKDELSVQLIKFKSIWPELKNRLQSQLVPSQKVRENLMAVGAPFSPEQIGISLSRMRNSFVRAWFIRSRFTILDLGMRTGYLGKWLDELYDMNELKT